ncbi:MAG: UMP kinase [Candidatus Hydrogenedentes bacterium]|nr:UMP kinase [Candidatus Hydrogenedentota bacterium]
MSKPAYKRILLKLSGEALQGSRQSGIDFDAVGSLCDELKQVRELGVEVGLVVGGGNIFRGSVGLKSGLDKPTGDYMGMLATIINALALQSGLEARGVASRVLTAIEVPPVAEPYIRRRAVRHLEKERLVIFGAGTGNPFFTTDTAAALRASEIGAEMLFKATKVDGIYDCDPLSNADAKRYDELSYTEVLSRNLGVMDATAISLCRENRLPILVFDSTKPGNILKALQGENIGTLVRGG